MVVADLGIEGSDTLMSAIHCQVPFAHVRPTQSNNPQYKNNNNLYELMVLHPSSPLIVSVSFIHLIFVIHLHISTYVQTLYTYFLVHFY